MRIGRGAEENLRSSLSKEGGRMSERQAKLAKRAAAKIYKANAWALM